MTKDYVVIKQTNKIPCFGPTTEAAARQWAEENGGKINEIMADYKQYIFLTGHDLSLFDFVELAKTFKS